MKKVLILALAVLSSVFYACNDDETESNVVRVNQINVAESIEMYVGEEYSLSVEVLPKDAVNKEVHFTIEDASVATVNDKGLVVGVKAGETNVNVTCDEVTEKVSVTIKEIDKNAFIDKSGRVYKTVEINGEIWMAENLAYLPSVYTKTDKSADPRFYVYDYNGNVVSEAVETDNYKTYGVLYNYQAAIESCPEGWHLPSDKEWRELEIYMGMDPKEADKIGLEYHTGFFRGDSEIASKFLNQTGWGDFEYSNTSGLSLLPTGIFDSGFSFVGKVTHVWTSTKKGTDDAFFRGFNSFIGIEGIMRNYSPLDQAYAVRYVKGDADDYTYVPVEKVTLNEASVILKVGETFQLTPTILPENATDKAVVYSTLMESVATVSEEGLITAVGEGVVTISAVSMDNSSLRGNITVTVRPKTDDPDEGDKITDTPSFLVGTWPATDVYETYDGEGKYTDDYMWSDNYEWVKWAHDNYKKRFEFTFKENGVVDVVYKSKDLKVTHNLTGEMYFISTNKYKLKFDNEDKDIKEVDIEYIQDDKEFHMYINSENYNEDFNVKLIFTKKKVEE